MKPLASLHTWLTEPLPVDVAKSVQRLLAAEDVSHVSIMPDVHLAQDVCVGAVVATKQLIYPAAIGSDIGCGMAALAFDCDAKIVDNERSAGRVLARLYETIPTNKHRSLRDLPDKCVPNELSNRHLHQWAQRDGRVQIGTLGRGNHFLEFQADQDGRLWVMVHSGSRAMGQAITNCHLRDASTGRFGFKHLDSLDSKGQDYLADVEWARVYAAESRLSMLRATEQLMQELFTVSADWKSLLHCDHNHVRREMHAGCDYWVHRKGAQPAATDEPGLIPGSMATTSFHTLGRGCAEALRSCSHGAGRRLSRTDARAKIGASHISNQLEGLWYDHRQLESLRDEAPSAYKDIRSVMRAQRELVKIVRELQPLLSYKGR